MDYKKEICPICLKEFAEGDDIVVCPECGTPHHRECWKENGCCANIANHGENFEWHKTQQSEEPAPQTQSDYNSQQGNTNAPFQMPVIDPLNTSDDRFENLCMAGVNADKDEKTDGMRIGDIAFYIQQNARHYINKFIKNKKVTFNWAALLFGPAWFFYRKLYKAGAVFLALTVAISLFTYPLSEKLYKEQLELEAMITSQSENSEKLTMEDYMAMAQDTEYVNRTKSYVKRSAIVLAVRAIPHLAAALLANEFYKRKIKRDLEAVNQASEDKTMRRMLIVQRG
ncbi:MAG: DUF2628 domain-containing protein, partial [Clostridia bacterium]|nr:DUF2628 domain-containing protein [Clostridia bacterium]